MKVLIHKEKREVVDGREFIVAKAKQYFVTDLSKDVHTLYGTISQQDLSKPSGSVIKSDNGKEFFLLDASFIDIVGNDLVNCYNQDSTCENKIIETYWKMIKSNPGNIEIHLKLLEILNKQDHGVCYFKVLESAFQNGLYISDSTMNIYYYETFNDQVQFKALVKKYNEKNKPLN